MRQTTVTVVIVAVLLALAAEGSSGPSLPATTSRTPGSARHVGSSSFNCKQAAPDESDDNDPLPRPRHSDSAASLERWPEIPNARTPSLRATRLLSLRPASLPLSDCLQALMSLLGLGMPEPPMRHSVVGWLAMQVAGPQAAGHTGHSYSEDLGDVSELSSKISGELIMEEGNSQFSGTPLRARRTNLKASAAIGTSGTALAAATIASSRRLRLGAADRMSGHGPRGRIAGSGRATVERNLQVESSPELHRDWQSHQNLQKCVDRPNELEKLDSAPPKMWVPERGRYLLAHCIFGRMSNQVSKERHWHQ